MGHTRFFTSPVSRPLCCAALLAALAGCAQTGQNQNVTAEASTPGGNTGLGQPPGVMNVADAAIAGGDPAMALKVSQSVLATDPKNLDALYHEGAAYYAIGRCEDSIAVYKVALSIDAASSPAQLGLGRCLLKRDAAQAETAFAAAVQDDPGNAAALNDLGVARDLQGKHAAAVPPYQQSLLLDPGNLATEVNLGMSMALSGDGADALQYLGPLATGADATPKIREDYAAALVADGRTDEARQVLAVDLTPDQVNQLIADFQSAIAAAQPDVTPAAPVATAAAVPAAPQEPPPAPLPAGQTAFTAAPIAAPPTAPIAEDPEPTPEPEPQPPVTPQPTPVATMPYIPANLPPLPTLPPSPPPTISTPTPTTTISPNASAGDQVVR